MRPASCCTLVSLCVLACVAERAALTNQMAESGTRYLTRAARDPVTGRGMKQILLDVARSFRERRAFVRRQAALVRQLAYARESGVHGVLAPHTVEAAIAGVRAALENAQRSGAALGSLTYTRAA